MRVIQVIILAVSSDGRLVWDFPVAVGGCGIWSVFFEPRQLYRPYSHP
jgi:hypothetical protein